MPARFLLLLLFVFLHAKGAQGEVPFMDLMDYRRQLLIARGILPRDCSMDLRVRPALRQHVLEEAHDFAWFLSGSQYKGVEQKADQNWAEAHQKRISAEKENILNALRSQGVASSPWSDSLATPSLGQFGFYPGFYPEENFASYQVGPADLPWYQPAGYVFKVFFEFADPAASLTPDRFHEFSRLLLSAGFHGDSKIPLLRGWARFAWNNVVVHAPSVEDALIAERVGLAYFGQQLLSFSRGVDVQNKLTGNVITDWPGFLCSVDPQALPPMVLKYLRP